MSSSSSVPFGFRLIQVPWRLDLDLDAFRLGVRHLVFCQSQFVSSPTMPVKRKARVCGSRTQCSSRQGTVFIPTLADIKLTLTLAE